MDSVFRQLVLPIVMISVITVIAGAICVRSFLLRNSDIAKYHTVKNNYEVYLDGQKIDGDNVDVDNYIISFDDYHKKVLLTTERGGLF